ncbi:hypothetical protein [Streptomyces sp. NPDC058595]|uniref:hypothetical protein n=1 Tax=Streptomyces sp. NPDC058595 TaxID=3346550 RepID=UPI003660F75A
MTMATRPPRGIRRVYKYGFFTRLDPVCPARVRQYPELAAVRDATPAQRRTMHPGDLEDSQHQWSYTTGIRVMQCCHECGAVRPAPLAGYPDEARTFILQQFISHHVPTGEAD